MKVLGIRKSYEGKTVLDVEEHEFAPGRIHAVIGANGSGKSTLAKVISGVIEADGGVVEPRGIRIGFMPQRCYAFYGTLMRNVMMGASGDCPGEEASRRARDLIGALGLSALEGKSAKRLSGGETARMALARVLMGNYDFLVLDEPTAALDVKSTLSAEQLIAEYRDCTGAGIVLVTHSIKQVRRLADEVVFMAAGKVVERGPAKEVLGHTRTSELQTFLDFA